MEQIEIPYMTKITKDTGVSISTISRFAQRSGFYNFAEMRAKFNVKLGDSAEIFNNGGLSNFIKKAKRKLQRGFLQKFLALLRRACVASQWVRLSFNSI